MRTWLRVFLPFAAAYFLSYFLRNVNGRTLVSNNEEEFRSIPGLKVENWAGE